MKPIESLLFDKLFSQHGPLVDIESAVPILAFNTRGALLRAISQGRLPLHLVRPVGRRKAFLATEEIARYLARISEPNSPMEVTM